MSEEDLNEANDESSLFIRTKKAISRINKVFDGMNFGNQDYDEIDRIFEKIIDDKLNEQLHKNERNTSEACNIMINIINNLQTQLVKIIYSNQDVDESEEIPKFQYDEFLANLNKLQLKEVGQIVIQFKNSKEFVREHISEFTKDQISYLAPIYTIYSLINQLQSVYSSQKDTNKIQNLLLDSDYIRNNESFSNILYQINAFSFLYHKGLYINKIPDILINAKLSKSYFQIFKYYEKDQNIPPELIKMIKKNKYYSNNLPEDMNSFDYSPYKWDKSVTPLQQICSSLFKCKKCRYLFKGLMKDLFVVTYSVFNSENINHFKEWISWLGRFFETFGEIEYNIKYDKFMENLIVDLTNKIEKIKLLPQGFDFENSIILKTDFKPFINSINSFYDNMKEKILLPTENRKIKDDFLILKDKVFKLMMENDNPLKKSYELLFDKMTDLGQNITLDSYNFINEVFTSISQSSFNIEKSSLKIFEWPTNQNLKKLKVEEKLLESLISYSREFEIIESLEYSPKWAMMCELSEPEPLLSEFIKEKSISHKTITSYKSILRAQLLVDLYENEEKDPYNYCNTNKIIMFFNQFKDRFNFVDDNWAIIAQRLSEIYPIDFCISIPFFSPFDILSLLVNPLTKKQGCIFKQKQCPQELLDDFYDVYTEISTKTTKKSFKYVCKQIKSIFINYAKNIHPDIIDKYFSRDELDDFFLFYKKIQFNNLMKDIKEILEQIQIAFNFSESITTELNKDQFNEIDFEHLDFSDIKEIDFDHFNEYLNKNPCSGFYISQFPQVKDKISKIIELCINEDEYTNDKFPLSLFEFRIFSQINCIKFQIPSKFPQDSSDEFQEFIFKEISDRLNKSKLPLFSHFIPFLLESTPSFITDACHSEYLRNIIINLISTSSDKLLKIEIMNFFKRFLPSIIDILGSEKWGYYVTEELKNDSRDEIIRFLTNPWRFALEDIFKVIEEDYRKKEFDVQKVVKNILNMILNLSSEKSIAELKECVNKDESELQEKMYHEFLNSNTKTDQETEIKKELNKQWTDYSKYIKTYLSKIPQLQTSNTDNKIHQPEDSYDHFYRFFSQALDFLPCRNSEVIVLIPKRAINQTYILNYTVQNKILSVKFNSQGGKPMLFLPPKNQSVQSLNLYCEGTEIKIFSIQSDPNVVKFKYSSMKSIEETYKQFSKCFKEIQKEDFDRNDHIQIKKKVDKIKILFGDITLEEFIDKIKVLSTKYHTENIESSFYIVDKFYRIKNDILELEKLTNISFTIDHMEKPHHTTNFLS